MTAHVLITGTLFRSPEQRTSKAGRPFATAAIRLKDGDRSQFWNIVAFSESVQAELLQLTEGDAISCQGQLRVETYEKDGMTKLSLSIIGDHVLSLRQPAKKRKPVPDKQPPGDARPQAPYGDTIPF